MPVAIDGEPLTDPETLLAATGRAFVLSALFADLSSFGTTFCRTFYLTATVTKLGFSFGSASRKECQAEGSKGNDKYFLHRN